ncbi:hypothetical protein G7Y89_g1680 [Cudoniella acicularis]|uniref:F-box domain-containing protein n=1 Tax=Cudoniella acicularis TaxID=354080 RepID=A0A8H4W9B9_9HELO|nr:hypothetical protein G7Y89_g1680 [Cudoniella acicularis]
MLGLLSLPYEVLAFIIGNVNFDDVFNLGLTCRDLKFLIMEESICKSILQSKIRYSAEAKSAMSDRCGNAEALRRAAKRRNALATVSPYTVATIGFCDTYVYSKGVLCYTLDDKIRVLDLHNSSDHEVVIYIPGLLTQALSDIRDHRIGTFHILYYSNSIISCLYQSSGPDSTAWLISFSIGKRAILLVEELESTEKLFVRHNKEYLYYGTHSEIDADGHKKWVIHGYSFKSQKWFEQKIHLSEMAGSDIGSTNCFEIHGSNFYALSNQTSFEVEEIDWTSFYHCIRFPLDSPRKELLEKTDNKNMWRRQHQEGPLDERWMFLRLDEDEITGKLRILESRKEWYQGGSRSQRTYYKTDIVFPKPKEQDLDIHSQPENFHARQTPTPITISSTIPLFRTHNYFASDGKTTTPTISKRPHDCQTTHILAMTVRASLRSQSQKRAFYPTTQVAVPTSTWWMTHFLPTGPADNVSAYVDHLADSARPLAMQTALSAPPSADLHIAFKELYREEGISFWPAAQDPNAENRDEELDKLYKLLNPPTHLGSVHGTADDRSMVYVTGPPGQPQALIFVGFDAAVRLRGVKRWGGLLKKGVGEGPHVDGRATGPLNPIDVGGGGSASSTTPLNGPYVDEGEKTRTVSIDRKGKGKEAIRDFESVTGLGHQTVVELKGSLVSGSPIAAVRSGIDGGEQCRIGKKSWAWIENAMYLDIGLGYNFGLKPYFNIGRG